MDTIGLFQLENLILSRSSFVFIDVGTEERSALAPPLNQYLGHAKRMSPESVRAHLAEIKMPKEHPVVLISEDESEPSSVAHGLEAEGYSNIYIVTGGVVGLLSEL